MSKIVSFEVSTVEIPMRMSVEHALAKRVTARNILVEVRDEDGHSGWGESCPREYVTGETIDSVKRGPDRDSILPALRGRESAELRLEEPPTSLSARARRPASGISTRLSALAELAVAGSARAGATGQTAGQIVLGPVAGGRRARYSGVIAATEPEAVAEPTARAFGEDGQVRRVAPQGEGRRVDLEKNLEHPREPSRARRSATTARLRHRCQQRPGTPTRPSASCEAHGGVLSVWRASSSPCPVTTSSRHGKAVTAAKPGAGRRRRVALPRWPMPTA